MKLDKIIFIADIVGEPGRHIIAHKLKELISASAACLVVANAENAAGGKGLTGAIAKELFSLGIDVITLGNHTFDKKEIETILDDQRILRPANYPESVKGKGYGIFKTRNGIKIAVVNLMGRVYMPNIDCPFTAATRITEAVKTETPNIIVDFHAEITSEKLAMGNFLNGRVTAVLGTHTHVPTADERILSGGTAYITDTGMTGPAEGVIGMDTCTVIKKFMTGIPQHFVISSGKPVMQGCTITFDSATGKAEMIERFSLN